MLNMSESERETSLVFSQTLQKPTMATSSTDTSSVQAMNQRTQWLLNAPEPPPPWTDLITSMKNSVLPNPTKSPSQRIKGMFPILQWLPNYKATKFKKDLMAGLTLASLCIPQSIGYATLAKLDPQYGLYTSIVPPLIYAVMGTSRELAIGPVAVVSLLLSSMVQKLEDPVSNPVAYRNLVTTVTFFAGLFQAIFGLFRLGFLVEFLSHAVLVGFMGGAAIVIGLQQLKGLLGISYFTNKTDIVSVIKAVSTSFHHPWNPLSFLIGSSFLIFIFIARFLGKRSKKLFWVSAIAPLISVILSTLIVFLTKADEHGVKTVKHIKGGLNPISIHQLNFSTPYLGEVAKIGLIVAIVALTEAIAVGRSFASVKGYHLNGSKEMFSLGFMNIVGSFTSCYVATGSFSRTAVNFSAGCETAMSNVVMAITVLVSLLLLTRLLYYTPIAILASIILSALPGLIDIKEAYNIWKTDKLDFLACIGAFFGVLFASVEIGLLLAVTISFAKILLISIQPGIETLGRVPGTDVFDNVNQYPMAVKTPGILTIRLKSGLLCFANANFIRERIMKLVTEGNDDCDEGYKGTTKSTTQALVLDISNVLNIDTSGIASLEELKQNLAKAGVELAIAGPRWQVIQKLRATAVVGGSVFISVAEAVEAFLGANI